MAIGLGTAALIGGGAAALGGGIGSYFQAKGYKEAAAKQAESMRWGYGYPEWLVSALRENVVGAEAGGEEYMSAIQDVISAVGAESPEVKTLLEGYVQDLEQYRWGGEAKARFEELPQTELARSLRAAEETSLTRGGARERGLDRLSLESAQAMTAQKVKSEEIGYTRGRDIDQTQLATRLQAAGIDAATAQKIAELTLQGRTGGQNLLSDALRTATQIPGQPVPWPGVGTGAAMGASLAQSLSTAGQLGMMYGMQPQQSQLYNPYAAGSGQNLTPQTAANYTSQNLSDAYYTSKGF